MFYEARHTSSWLWKNSKSLLIAVSWYYMLLVSTMSDISIPIWYTITACITSQAPLWSDSFQYHEILQTARLFSITIIAIVITTCISNSLKQIESK